MRVLVELKLTSIDSEVLQEIYQIYSFLRKYILASDSLLHLMSIQSKTHLEMDSLKENNIAIQSQHYKWYCSLWQLLSLCHHTGLNYGTQVLWLGRASISTACLEICSEVTEITASCTNLLLSRVSWKKKEGVL